MSRPGALELAFLPAALEVEHSPPRGGARGLLWLLATSLFATLTWACIGRVDIVGLAPGRVVPTGRVKVVQPLESAMVKRIHVREGEHVVAGQTLFELDPTVPAADRAQLRHERRALVQERARLRTLLIETGAWPADEETVAGLPPVIQQPSLLQTQLLAQRTEYRAMLEELGSKQQEKQAERVAIEARIAELTNTLPLITEEAGAYATLVGRGTVPRVQWLALERERISVQQALAVQRAQRTMLGAHLATLDAQRAANIARYRSRWSTDLTDTERRLAGVREELAKTTRRLQLTALQAPIDGTVQQLAIHTEGGVVTTAQPLLVIVPDEAGLEVEARVSTRDIGFVRAGQGVAIKIDTFEFTKYGALHGRIRAVSRDAVRDEARTLHYLAHIELTQSYIDIGSTRAPLAPGMTIVAEVKMGQRRVIEYLLTPLLRYRQESARER